MPETRWNNLSKSADARRRESEPVAPYGGSLTKEQANIAAQADIAAQDAANKAARAQAEVDRFAYLNEPDKTSGRNRRRSAVVTNHA